jgi:hypothetical protein
LKLLTLPTPRTIMMFRSDSRGVFVLDGEAFLGMTLSVENPFE